MSQVKLIHRFWAGREMPEEYVAYGAKWAELNPGWEVIDWDLGSALQGLRPDLQEVIEDLYRQDAGRYGIELYVQMADVFGYWLVYRHGGVYTNCDIEPLKPIEGILPDKAWASYENNEDGRIVNAIIGAPNAYDDFWHEVLRGLKARYFASPGEEMVLTTGPGYLTIKANEDRDSIHVFPVETFNPVHWSSVPKGGKSSDVVHWKDKEIPEGVYAIHQWGHRKDGRTNRVATATQA